MSRKQREDDDWMEHAVSKPGALRKSLHIKNGEKISENNLRRAIKSRSPLMRKRASLAMTFRKND